MSGRALGLSGTGTSRAPASANPMLPVQGEIMANGACRAMRMANHAGQLQLRVMPRKALLRHLPPQHCAAEPHKKEAQGESKSAV